MLWQDCGMAETPDEPQLPQEVITPLAQMAIATHETFMAFIDAGFSERQGMALTLKTLELGIEAQLYAADYDEVDFDEEE